MSHVDRRAFAIVLIALFAAAPLAGCAKKAAPPSDPIEQADDPCADCGTTPTPPPPSTPPPSNPTPPQSPQIVYMPTLPPVPPQAVVVRVPQVVVALVDTGVNPYHKEFRDPSALAYAHPSTYITGYPKDTPALRLSLNDSKLSDALKDDASIWKSVKPNTLYWVPGTRIIGMVTTETDGATPAFDDDGHGTMTASRAAGATTSLAPTARIVAIEGLSGASVAWAASQPWIDLQSNSWASRVPDVDIRAAFSAAAKVMPTFVASGNGIGQEFGVIGQPALLGSTEGAPGVIAVGGHDNGQFTLWSGSIPDVVADACWNWAADGATIDKTGPQVGTGTSSATPYVAGEAAAIILKARALLGDFSVSHARGVLASGAAKVVSAGPLADGNLTLDELKRLVFLTADPRPHATPHDGDLCDPTMAPYVSGPADWGSVPADVPSYYLIGYGAVNVDTLRAAVDALAGGKQPAARDTDDQWHDADEALRALPPI